MWKAVVDAFSSEKKKTTRIDKTTAAVELENPCGIGLSRVEDEGQCLTPTGAGVYCDLSSSAWHLNGEKPLVLERAFRMLRR